VVIAVLLHKIFATFFCSNLGNGALSCANYRVSISLSD